MSDPQQHPTGSGQSMDRKWLEPGYDNALLIYILYLVSLVVGITVLIGLVLAYVNRGKSGDYIESHYTWLIRTFWIGLLYMVIAAALSLVAIGFVLMIAVVVWVIVRIVLGLQALSRREPMPNPESWWIR